MNGKRYLAIGLGWIMAVGAACAQQPDPPVRVGTIPADESVLPKIGENGIFVGTGWDPASPGTEHGSTGIGADGRMVGPHAATTHPDDLRVQPIPGTRRGWAYPKSPEAREAGDPR